MTDFRSSMVFLANEPDSDVIMKGGRDVIQDSPYYLLTSLTLFEKGRLYDLLIMV